MQFTYKIENYYPYEARAFVVYTPTDTAFEPLGVWVHISADLTEQQIKDAVVAAAPQVKWGMIKSAAALALVGFEEVGVTPVPPVPIEPTPEEIAANAEVSRIARLWYAAHDYEYQQVSGSAIGLLAMGVMQGKPKCVAVQNWIKSIWVEYYTRKANGTSDYDFSIIGNCPHSVPELMVELGM